MFFLFLFLLLVRFSIANKLYISPLTPCTASTCTGTKEKPYLNLKTALENINKQDGEIIFLPGNYTSLKNTGLTLDNKNLILSSENAGDVIIDCQSVSNGWTLISGHFTINNLTFINCTTTQPLVKNGGALWSNNSIVNIYNSSFMKNVADLNGGAIGIYLGEILIFNCNFNYNKALFGGALFFISTTVNIKNNTNVMQNVAVQGGAGILANLSTVVISNGSGIYENINLNENETAEIYCLNGSFTFSEMGYFDGEIKCEGCNIYAGRYSYRNCTSGDKLVWGLFLQYGFILFILIWKF